MVPVRIGRGRWAAVALGLVLGCAARLAEGAAGAGQPAEAGMLRVTGTVRKTEVGVNCWRFEASDGTGYELMPSLAPEEVLRDGQRFTLILQPREGVMSTCMVGRIVEVIRIVSR